LALKQFRRSRDGLWEARLRNNRGILLAYQGRAAAAERDLSKAADLYQALGQDILAGEARWNLGFAAGLRGDLVTALQVFESAGTQLDEAGALRGMSFLDRCQVLLSAGLLSDAREAIHVGLAQLARSAAASDAAEARLLLSETLLLAGDVPGALASAGEALIALEQQGRRSLALMARLAVLRATAGDPLAPAWQSADRTAAALLAAGWADAATEISLFGVRRALEARRPVDPLSLSAAFAATKKGPIPQRMRAWHTVALARLGDDDRAGASQALLAGLRVHDRHRATLSALELQVHTAARAAELAETGLRLALGRGHAAGVLVWAERWRAGSLLVRPVKPPKDQQLASRLTELRAVSAELQQARLSGEEITHLQRRQHGLERRVTERARALRADVTQIRAATPQSLHEALGERALIEYVESDDQLYAVVVAGNRSSLHRLGGAANAMSELEMMRFALGRLAAGGSPRMTIATRLSLASAAARLDAILLAPLGKRLADRPLVVVPTGGMHVLPWGLLASAGNRSLTVAPSASVWLGALDRRRQHRGHVALVAGPGLPGARAEIEAVSAVYADRARVLRPEEASVEAVSSSLDGASYAHVAAHGRFRADNPLFSSLEMADGPLTVYDLENIQTAPALVVLSACDSGLSSVHPGDEIMGLVSALLRIGTRTLIASVAPVPDEVARDTLVGFHTALAQGAAAAEALLTARMSLDADDRVAAAAFVCFGSS
jgi:CHAT domain-containing protein